MQCRHLTARCRYGETAAGYKIGTGLPMITTNALFFYEKILHVPKAQKHK